jgi:hypothetical protein
VEPGGGGEGRRAIGGGEAEVNRRTNEGQQRMSRGRCEEEETWGSGHTIPYYATCVG